ncbi:hypothetical protein HanIR_Chr06g0258331 [Helianthus annuus]|nr:hypothetical protein HanIR_Chr06g0258331 [Helianthus annuus]
MTRSSSARCEKSFARNPMSFWICFSIFSSCSFSIIERSLLSLLSNSSNFDGPSDGIEEDVPRARAAALLLSLSFGCGSSCGCSNSSKSSFRLIVVRASDSYGSVVDVGLDRFDFNIFSITASSCNEKKKPSVSEVMNRDATLTI